eukprot:c3673_g1_i1.p1 GENE.c3673_g1_i1~~c3673_g1_i1.p1  ORF type:complete len:330 (+),score=37.38 c3673_g1_i1:453-1442(+)
MPLNCVVEFMPMLSLSHSTRYQLSCLVSCVHQEQERPGKIPRAVRQECGDDETEQYHDIVCCHNKSCWPVTAYSLPGSAHPIERVSAPSLEWFLRHAISLSKPIVVTDATLHWPAFNNKTKRWCRISRFRKVAGPRIVPVEVGQHYMSDKWTQQFVRVNDVLDHMLGSGSSTSEKIYLAQYPLFDHIPELGMDACEPDYTALVDGEVRAKNAWIGPKNTVSCLHHDPHHNLLCQVVGRKFLRLFLPDQTHLLYPHEGFAHNTSQVDLAAPDHVKYPLYAQAQGIDCVLEPGEMLYIPPKCWHYVVALDVSMSVSFWFGEDRLRGWSARR